MKLHFSLTEQDQSDWFLYYLTHSPLLRKWERIWRLAIPLLSLAIAGAWLEFVDASPFVLFICVVVAVLWFAFYPALYRYGSVRRFMKLLAESSNKNCLGGFTLELLEDRIRTAGNGMASEMPYGNLKKIVENKGCFYIDMSLNEPLLLPLTAFADENERRQFLKILKEKQPDFAFEEAAATSR